MSGARSDWKCPKCNIEIKGVTFSEIADVGVPVCSECGDDMELMEAKVRKRISPSNFIWSINRLRKIKIKDIREYEIQTPLCEGQPFVICAYGFFGGGGIPIKEVASMDEAVNFIDEMSSPAGIVDKIPDKTA